MSGGAGGLVLPSANAGSPYVRSGATNDPVARMRADRAAEEDRRLALLRNQEEYDLLHSRSPRRRAGSAARVRLHADIAPLAILPILHQVRYKTRQPPQKPAHRRRHPSTNQIRQTLLLHRLQRPLLQQIQKL